LWPWFFLLSSELSANKLFFVIVRLKWTVAWDYLINMFRSVSNYGLSMWIILRLWSSCFCCLIFPSYWFVMA
jgi:hypothetical protein